MANNRACALSSKIAKKSEKPKFKGQNMIAKIISLSIFSQNKT